MIDPEPGLRLPLVHHFMEHGVLDLWPRMSSQVTSADRNLQRPPGPDLHRQLTQPGPHPARKADRNLAESSPEMLRVQPLVKLGEPVQENEVAGASALA
jgi:hypothetical protein